MAVIEVTKGLDSPSAGPQTRPKSSQTVQPGGWPHPAPQGPRCGLGQKLLLIEALAALAGMAGAVLVAIPGMAVWGFPAFLASNAGWLLFSAAHGHWRMFVQQLVFLASSLLGIWNFCLAPLLRTTGG